MLGTMATEINAPAPGEDARPAPGEDARAAAREKYAAPAEPKLMDRSLYALGWISALGFVLAVVSLFGVFTVETLQAFTIWSGLIGTGLMVGFLALIAQLAAKAIVENK